MPKYRELPAITESLFEIDPIDVRSRPIFAKAKEALDELRQQTEGLSISSDAELEKAQAILQSIKRFRGEVDAVSDEAIEELRNAEQTIRDRAKQLTGPSAELAVTLGVEAKRYQVQREMQKSTEEKAARERQEAQKKEADWSEGILILRAELATARQVADNADRAGEKETASQIRKGLQRFNSLDSSPGSFTDPAKLSKEVRKLVAEALQNEQQRA